MLSEYSTFLQALTRLICGPSLTIATDSDRQSRYCQQNQSVNITYRTQRKHWACDGLQGLRTCVCSNCLRVVGGSRRPDRFCDGACSSRRRRNSPPSDSVYFLWYAPYIPLGSRRLDKTLSTKVSSMCTRRSCSAILLSGPFEEAEPLTLSLLT